jgi:hypothetical protein
MMADTFPAGTGLDLDRVMPALQQQVLNLPKH